MDGWLISGVDELVNGWLSGWVGESWAGCEWINGWLDGRIVLTV